MTTLLEVDDLHTVIRQRRSVVRAVDGVSLTVGAGETVGLVGESGCGKTITGRSILRLLPPGGHIVSGEIRLDGCNLTKLPEEAIRRVRGDEVALVFQDPMTSLNPTMTIGDQIAEHFRYHRGASKREATERAHEMLALVGVPNPAERLESYAHQLSGGLRQRAMIAIALACGPKLLIADEPTTALDVTIQSQILTLLAELKERLGMGLLLITHDMGVIAGQADRVAVMYAGQVVETATTSDLFAQPKHPYTAALLDAIPQLDQDPARRLFSIPGSPPDLSNPPPGCRFASRCLHATEECRDFAPASRGTDEHTYACFHPLVGRQDQPISEITIDRASLAPTGIAGPPMHRRGLIAGREQAETSSGPSGDERHSPVPVLIVDHLVREFPVTRGVLQRRVGTVKAVSDVSFSVGRGEIFGLVGESGSGKTTIGRCIVALERADSGSVVFDGVDIGNLTRSQSRAIHRQLQLMFQDPYASLDPRMRIGATLREPLAVQGIGTRQSRHERIGRLLGEVGLRAGAASLYPHEFSGGQRQRIGFARALTVEPRLIVADEPVSALDVSIRSQILNLMKELQRSYDLTYIVISHDLSVVHYLADRIGVLYLGKLVELGPRDEIYERPIHPYTAGLLKAIPVPNPAVERSKSDPGIVGELPSALKPPSGCRFHTRCPHATEQCVLTEPPMQSFGHDHLAACHHPLAPPVGNNK